MTETITMTLNSEKKHSIRYDNKASEIVTSIYVLKTADIFKDGTPEKILVTVEAAE